MNKAAKEYGDDYPAVRDYRKLKEGATEMVRSIVIILNAMLHRTETAEMHRIFEADDLNLREFATGVGGTVEHPTDQKMALFLIIDDEDTTFNFVCAMLYTQALDILCRMADVNFRDQDGKLPIPLEFWMDEFYAGGETGGGGADHGRDPFAEYEYDSDFAIKGAGGGDFQGS